MKSVLGMLTLLLALPAAADEGRSDEFVSDIILDLSKDMAYCAGRQEAVAGVIDTYAKPSNGEGTRRLGKSFQQCALYLRTRYVNRESAEFYRQQVAEEAAFGKRVLEAAMKMDDKSDETELMLECRALDEKVKRCQEDQKRFLEEGNANRGQKEVAPSQPEPTQANSGRRLNSGGSAF